jgi:hypothetical protein
MIRRFHFYHGETGVFATLVFHGHDHDAQLNAPKGYKAIAGEFEVRTQRIDIATGRAVPYDSPAAAAQKAVHEEARARRALQQELDRLKDQQRELVVAHLTGAADKAKELRETESRIAALRAKLN